MRSEYNHGMARNRKMTLVRQLSFAYVAIAVIPVIILVLITVTALIRERIDMIVRTSSVELDETETRVHSILDSVARLETSFQMRSDLISIIASPDTDWESYETVRFYIDEIEDIQRELFIASSVDNMHVFLFSDAVPERWPIILRSERMSMENLESPWNFSGRETVLGVSGTAASETVTHTTKLTHYGKQYGFLQIVINLSTILPEMYTPDDDGMQGDFAFSFSSGDLERIVPVDSMAMEDSIGPQLLEDAAVSALSMDEDRGTVTVSKGFVSYRFVFFRDDSTSLLFMKLCPTADILSAYSLYALCGVASFILIMAILLFLSIQATKRQTKALVAIMDGMVEVSKGNFDVNPPSIPLKAVDVKQAGDAFIAMTTQLRAALVEMQEKEALLADTQIKAMQNQINVHFLINTVESIKMQAMMNGDEGVEHSLDLLGELFRYSLRWKERMVVLREEIDYIQTYVELMNYRNDFHVDCIVDIDSSLEMLAVPKMILQPVVENAFRYSFDVTGEDGTIIIRAEDEDDRVLLAVANDGVPFDSKARIRVMDYLRHDVPERQRGSGSIGLKNIQERLFMFYGPDYNIEIWQEEGWTRISIPIGKGGGTHEDTGSR